jgi:hypothetical protein
MSDVFMLSALCYVVMRTASTKVLHAHAAFLTLVDTLTLLESHTLAYWSWLPAARAAPVEARAAGLTLWRGVRYAEGKEDVAGQVKADLEKLYAADADVTRALGD